MKLSIIVPVLNSHEVLRRQLLHFERMGLPPETELIVVDDGSDPPLENTSRLPVTMHRTHDTRPWTWALARNAGATLATGEYLLLFDLDHILTSEVLNFVLNALNYGVWPRIHFARQFGVLDQHGQLLRDRNTLMSYGLLTPRSRIESHQNSFAMQRSLFWELGGYREDLVGKPYPQGEDSDFYRKWQAYSQRTGIHSLEGPTLYVFPTGRWCGDVDHNPQGLFHELSRKTRHNYWWRQQCRTDLQQT